MFENLRRDRAQYAMRGISFTHPGFWIIAIYRYGVWADSLPFFLRIPMWALYRIARLPLLIFNVDLWAGPGGASIGAGLCLIHPGNIIIGKGVEVGEDCVIFHEVTIGTGHTPGTPKIGRNVTLYPGARVLGGILIGDDSMVGANCVVTKDMPPQSVMLAAPGRVISRSLSPAAKAWDQRTPAGVEPAPPETKH